jgi:hypothetical protein
MDSELVEIVEKHATSFRGKVVQKIYAGDGIPPPNAKSTADAKGSSHTLIDTSTMVNSIDVQLVSNEGDTCDVAVGIFDEGVAEYATYNEFGVPWSHRPHPRNDAENREEEETREWFIPPRSFLRSTYDEEIENITNDIAQDFNAWIDRKWKK